MLVAQFSENRNMDYRTLFRLSSFLLLLLLSSCSVVTGIFKVGFWTGVIVLLLVVFLIMYLVRKTGRRR